jgi:hypothetical protein
VDHRQALKGGRPDLIGGTMQRTGNKLYEMIEAPNENAVVGVTFIPGAGLRVGILKDGLFEHLSPQGAWRWAQELQAEAEEGSEPTAFVKALGLTAGKVRAMGLAGQEVDGHG